jgi:CheY-like chemotaxis protein
MTVSDTGTGMTEEAQDHLFEPFFTTKDHGQGTGLGLAQVYGIVKQHKGFIGVDTAVGEGTTFTIYLPLAENAEEMEEASEWERRPSHGEGETILVIEDSKPLRTAIKSGLESLDYHVVTAINGQEALEMSLQGVDLVLTDMVMPKMNGDVLLKELRRQAPQLKVIAMTGHVLDIDVEDLKADGFTNAILKPFSIQDLTAVVRDALDDNARGP